MPIISNSPIVVTDQDIELAREALVEGYGNCPRVDWQAKNCDCDPGAIDGCKAKVEAIAKTIAAVRRM